MIKSEIVKGLLIGAGYITGVALILVGFLAYLCIGDCRNELLTAGICIGGLGIGGLTCHQMDKLSKKYPRRSGNFYED